MKYNVKIYVKRCSNCQKNKYAIYIKYKEIQYQILSTVFSNEIIINFIIKLSESENLVINEIYNSTLMIMNRYINYLHLILFK